MSPPPLPGHLSPAGLADNPGPPVLCRHVCASPATVFVGVWNTTEFFFFLYLFTFDYSNVFRILLPLAPQPPQLDESSIPHPPVPPLMTPLCGPVSLAWAAAGSLTPLIEMRMSIKRAPEFTAQAPTSKGQCGSACLSACVCLCTFVCEGRSSLVLHLSSRFQLLCQLKDAAARFPNKKTRCRIPVRVRFPHSSA